ncbi:hypothetical protein ACFQFC_18205 [Amorphoplanes digitatis]|uniref:Uncharacterized protein n=1 Tax=Actinoplanes digitatis TaxID=1868 RepID=A0A7W7MTC0_9ACTN|nr:hypothetical protein [Actinoplanes digitatis]MBB4766148.1 hypothetical protein [Actinoplanes digitatis]BFE76156.1 hypothetical protein GCM10020092_094570 [Actinoplanes digitatis]GID96574.1 hypothetical protein Adi01nite_59860 [Actinoplanes digitatis]
MGNSAVYRIHTGDDVHEAYEMAQRLLALAETTCGCPPDIDAEAQTGTHTALDRYLAIDSASVALSIPADLVSQVMETLEPHLGAHDPPSRHRDGGAYLMTDLTPALIAALRQLPPMAAEIQTPELRLPNDLSDVFLAVVNRDQASVSWDVCWPDNHGRSGFELGINGRKLWHPETPAGHSVYVHVAPRWPEQAHELAATVGGRVMGEPATGW